MSRHMIRPVWNVHNTGTESGYSSDPTERNLSGTEPNQTRKRDQTKIR